MNIIQNYKRKARLKTFDICFIGDIYYAICIILNSWLETIHFILVPKRVKNIIKYFTLIL